MELLQQTRNYLLTRRLIVPGESTVAAVSGGRDSCVMLHILRALRKELGFTLAVAHFDHGLREQSAPEQQFVRELAASYGLPFYGGAADVLALAQGGNLEDTARRARYAFLREAAAKAGAQTIATAHHAQDQAETVLLHLLRGSGLEGLAAIAPREGDLLRPLLFALPEQLEAYRAEHNLQFYEDESNADPRFLRNHLRLNILPQLRQINPRLLTSISTTADICREDNNLLTAWAAVALDELWQEDKQALAEGIFTLPPALQRRILRMAVARVAGEETVPSFAQTEAVLKLKEEQSVSVSGGWLIYRRGALFIAREQPPLPEHKEIIPLIADGAWHALADWGWEYQAGFGSASSYGLPPFYAIALPADMAENLTFRTRREGDAVPSQGKMGRRKIKEIFIDAHIPPYQRTGWPLLTDGEKILWLPRLYRRDLPPGGKMLIIIARPFTE